MTTTNLDYHSHLDEIASADVAYVRRRDTEYRGSWKKRGGIGAWFTIVRPWDRLNNMLDPTAAPGDQREAPISARINAPVPAFDIIEAIVREEGSGLLGADGSALACVRDLRRYLLLLEAEITERKTDLTPVVPRHGTTPPERCYPHAPADVVEMYRWPWRISSYRYTSEGATCGMACDAWRQLLPDLYVLEPTVTVGVYARLSQEVRDYYVECVTSDGTVARSVYVLDMSRCPSDLRPNYPILVPELNHKEHDSIQAEYRGMYYWHEDSAKWILRDQFSAWTVK